MITIWGRKNSINVQKVLWCCGELDLAYRQIDAGGAFGLTETADYTAMNPNKLVPTIDDNGFVLWESNVIVRYLSFKHGFNRLYPSDIEPRFDAERWMDWQSSSLWPDLRIVFIGLVRTPEGLRDKAIITQSEQRCVRFLKMLDDRLRDREYVAGNSFTMADIPLGAAVYRWYTLDIRHPSLPSLERWYRNLCERPAYLASVMLPLS
jgi:glutathione S-transferase